MENISRNRSIKFKNFNSLVEAIQTLSSKNSEWKVKHFFRRLSILVSEPSCDSSRFIRIYQAKIWKRLSLPMTTHCYFFFSMHVILWLLLWCGSLFFRLVFYTSLEMGVLCFPLSQMNCCTFRPIRDSKQRNRMNTVSVGSQVRVTLK